MAKYLLLLIPLYLYRYSFLYPNLDEWLNLTLIISCLILLYRRTSLHSVLDWIVGILFTVYFCILYQKTVFFVGFTFLQNHDFSPEHLKFLFSTVNLIPFRTIIDQIGQWPAAGAAGYQLSGNLLMLAPLGFSLLYFKWAKNWKQALLYAFLCTFAIEFIQFLHNLYFRLFSMGMNRSTDIDDILLNTAGALLGIGIYTLWSGITGRRTRAHQPKHSVSSK